MNKVAPIRRAYHRQDNAECGHGTCAATVDCTGECAMKALSESERKYFHEMPDAEEDEDKLFAAKVVAAILIAVTAFSIYMATK